MHPKVNSDSHHSWWLFGRIGEIRSNGGTGAEVAEQGKRPRQRPRQTAQEGYKEGRQ
jgi:hypothetical protein